MNLLFDFTVDKPNNTIHISRQFAADADLVWDAFTKAEMLDQWMSPKPWRLQTKEMDFREGGRWLYAMISPENVFRWSLVEFIKIEPKFRFTTKNSFSDENGDHLDTGFTYSLTTTSFKAGAGITTVQIDKKLANLSELEQFIANGYYKEGMSMVMANLDEYLSALVTNK